MLKYFTDIINNLIALDPKSTDILNQLNKKYLTIEINEIPFLSFLKFQFDENGLHFVTDIEDHSSVTVISGSLLSFFTLFITKNPRQATQFGLKISGDIETSQKIQNLILNLEIDWEECLSRFTGNPIAYYLNKMLKRFKQKQTVFVQDLTHTSIEYLQEEIQFTPSKSVFEHFITQVESLSENIERLDAKLNVFERGECIHEPI